MPSLLTSAALLALIFIDCSATTIELGHSNNRRNDILLSTAHAEIRNKKQLAGDRDVHMAPYWCPLRKIFPPGAQPSGRSRIPSS
ncbi:hypothetical protein EV363DRAFT_1324456, partial [Boletus edulis]